MNDQIDILLDIKEALGRVEQKIDSHVSSFQDHVASDALMASDIKKLQLAQAKQSGFMRAIGLVGSFIGAGVGYFIERLMSHH